MLTKGRNYADANRNTFPKNIQQSTDFLSSFYDEMEKEKNSGILNDKFMTVANLPAFEYMADLYIPNVISIENVITVLKKVKKLRKFRIESGRYIDWMENIKYHPEEIKNYNTSLNDLCNLLGEKNYRSRRFGN